MRAGRWRPLTEGAWILGPLLGFAAVSAFAVPPAALGALALAGLVTFAFRDPERAVREDSGVALSPADGRVLRVGRVFDEHWQCEMVEVAIFLALWNVHVQRAPLDGRVVAQRRRAGGYRPAMTAAATHGNNQLATYLRTPAGPCTVTQISGIAARRIVTWVGEGEGVAQGDRVGMIKFGSQVTLRVPSSSHLLVDVGDQVRAGVTPIARLTRLDQATQASVPA